jgi:hypothetical protein
MERNFTFVLWVRTVSGTVLGLTKKRGVGVAILKLVNPGSKRSKRSKTCFFCKEARLASFAKKQDLLLLLPGLISNRSLNRLVLDCVFHDPKKGPVDFFHDFKITSKPV